MKEQPRCNTPRGHCDRDLRKSSTSEGMWTFCGYSGILRAKQPGLGEPTSLDEPSGASVRLQMNSAGPKQ